VPAPPDPRLNPVSLTPAIPFLQPSLSRPTNFSVCYCSRFAPRVINTMELERQNSSAPGSHNHYYCHDFMTCYY
jgi:hypothetical protein